jgi:type I site-specific restriction-modification system R (restriction) subunit
MTYPQGPRSKPLVVREQDIEAAFIEKLLSLKYTHRPDIRDRAALERNFRQKFETFTQRLEPLRDKRFVFIFDECHRSQFGDNHQAIKDFFPRAQLFGFTGTPIFEDNAARVQIADNQASSRTTADTFQRELHRYTITHAIEDKNVLRFHVDYYKVAGASSSRSPALTKVAGASSSLMREQDAPATLPDPNPDESQRKQKIVEAVPALRGDDARAAFIERFRDDRHTAELALMADLVPLLKQRAAGRDVSGLSAYEQ